MRQISAIFLAAIFLVIVSVALPDNSHAQTTDPYTEYLQNLNSYYTARKNFESSRARYISFQTVQSKQTVTNDAKLMLQTGRGSLTQYTYYLAQYLLRIPDTNKRVRDEILADLQTHNGYLQSIENVLTNTPTFTEINAQSQALTTRYGYIKVTANQVITYIDAIRTYQHLIRSKDLLTQLQNLNRTLPEDVKQKSIAQDWFSQAESDTSADEQIMVELIEKIYPVPTTENTNKRGFEYLPSNSGAADTELSKIKSNLINRTSKHQEIYKLMVEALDNL